MASLLAPQGSFAVSLGSLSTLNGRLLQEDLPSAFATSSFSSSTPFFTRQVHSAVAAAKISVSPPSRQLLAPSPSSHQPSRVEAFLHGEAPDFSILRLLSLPSQYSSLRGLSCRAPVGEQPSPIPRPPSHRPPRRPLPAPRPRQSPQHRRGGGLLRSFYRQHTGAGMIRVGDGRTAEQQLQQRIAQSATIRFHRPTPARSAEHPLPSAPSPPNSEDPFAATAGGCQQFPRAPTPDRLAAAIVCPLEPSGHSRPRQSFLPHTIDPPTFLLQQLPIA